MVATRQGAQGILDEASNAQLESEFGTSKIEDVVQQIIEKGQVISNKACPLPVVAFNSSIHTDGLYSLRARKETETQRTALESAAKVVCTTRQHMVDMQFVFGRRRLERLA